MGRLARGATKPVGGILDRDLLLVFQMAREAETRASPTLHIPGVAGRLICSRRTHLSTGSDS